MQLKNEKDELTIVQNTAVPPHMTCGEKKNKIAL